MFSKYIILAIDITLCYCYVAYEMFQGFQTSIPSMSDPPLSFNITSTDTAMNFSPLNEVMETVKPIPYKKNRIPSTSIKFNCSEDERPANIGPYEVPTQRDIVLFIKKTLNSMFNRYNEKAIFLLLDIKQASKAAVQVEAKCQEAWNKNLYKICVKRVTNKCELVTKSLVTSLERQKEDVSAFIEGKICKISDLKINPIQLIEVLAMEEASLDFALPGFLRLLHKCIFYCSKYADIL